MHVEPSSRLPLSTNIANTAMHLCVDLYVTWRCGKNAAELSHSARVPSRRTCDCRPHLRKLWTWKAVWAQFVMSPSEAHGWLKKLVSISDGIKTCCGIGDHVFDASAVASPPASTRCSSPQNPPTDPATTPCLLMTKDNTVSTNKTKHVLNGRHLRSKSASIQVSTRVQYNAMLCTTATWADMCVMHLLSKSWTKRCNQDVSMGQYDVNTNVTELHSWNHSIYTTISDYTARAKRHRRLHALNLSPGVIQWVSLLAPQKHMCGPWPLQRNVACN